MLVLSGEAVKEQIKNLKLANAKKKRLGRNKKCPCGSGKKYKKCCIDKI